MMKFGETKSAAAQFVVAKQRREIASHRGDEPVVDRNRNVITEEGRFESGRKISGARAKDICLHRRGERRGERKLVVLVFLVERVKGALAQLVIAFHEKRAERTLGERFFVA